MTRNYAEEQKSNSVTDSAKEEEKDTPEEQSILNLRNDNFRGHRS